MCLVEVEKSPKPVAACAMPASPNMKIFTDTPLVKKAREGVLELLLLNHPLDCPICDQGGECDLQDQVMNFGSDKSRFYEKKRVVEDKNCGPLIKTIMTRCIHCTRCVRFASEIIGVETEYLGTVNRGQQTEITPFVEKIILSELSGNLIDLCPVGALTSKPYAFNARPWELKSVESIDIFDSLGTPIRLDYKESNVIRILPRLKTGSISQEWITDKVRFSYDGLNTTQRILNPLISDLPLDNTQKSFENKFEINWESLIAELSLILETVPSNQICFIVGNTIETETLLACKLLSESLGISKIVYDKVSNIDSTFSKNFTFDLESIDNSDCYLLLGVNLRNEANLLNLKLQQNIKNKNAKIISIGSTFKSTFSSDNFLNLTFEEFLKILEGKHPASKILKSANSPLLICGSSSVDRVDSTQFLSTLLKYNKKIKILNSNSINFVSSESNFVGNLNLGISPYSFEILNDIKVIFLIHPSLEFINFLNETLEISFSKSSSLKPIIIYQSSHYPSDSNLLIDYFIPGKTFVEKEGRFFNIENKCQKTSKIYNSSKIFNNKEDYHILQILNEKNFQNLDELVSKLIELIPNSENLKGKQFLSLNIFEGLKLKKTLLKSTIEDFYTTHLICRNSSILGKCSNSNKKNSQNFLFNK